MKPLRSISSPQPTQSTPDMPLPLKRPRRLRRTPAMRALVAEHRVDVSDLIEPLFVVPGSSVRKEIASMPGVFQQSVDRMVEDVKAAAAVVTGRRRLGDGKVRRKPW